jgi:type I restriction enzyme S subunit
MTLHAGHERRGSWQDQGVAVKEGWTLKLLGDVCDFQRGLTYSKSDEVDISANVVLRATNIDLATNTLALDELKHISDKTFVPDIKKVKNGSLMICMASGSKGHLGKVAYIDRDYGFAFGGFMGLITARENLLPRYLFHLMTSKGYKDFISGLSDGANINNLTFDKLRAFPIPVPPLPEQQRIVDLLDEVFEALATAKSNTEQNLQNASALFECHLDSVFSQPGEGWAEATLGETCEMYQPKTISTKELVPDGPYSVFGANGIIGRYDKFNHEEPQLLVTCRGATCGSVNISHPKSWITANAMVVRPKDHALDLRFLEFVFRGGVDLSVAITGSAQPQITRTNLSTLLIRFPVDISEQIRVAETFQALAAEIKHLTSIYERKLAAVEELKTSLLHQAFSGEL